jgi:class 3 adenylate cyclase/tetratricopeptide (TPR) repeat protein
MTSEPVVERAGPESDRRPVTILFCDLVGYTRLASHLDPEEVHALLERFFSSVDSIVDRFGGVVDKHIGDAVMALFGAPRAHGDDAQRALRAALEIQAAVPKLSADPTAPLAVHLGIAAGEVVASLVGSERHRSYTVTGEAANIAARLLDRAAAGETLVSDAVHRATSHAANFEPLGPVALKGLDRRIDVFRLTQVRNAASEVTPLVGRSSELAQCRAALEATIDDKSGAVVLIRGEAGIGKTRLVEELQSIANELGMSRCTGFVLDFGTERGSGAVRTVLTALLGLGRAASLSALEEALVSMVRDAQLPSDDALYLRDLLEVPQPDAARPLYEAMDKATRMHGKESMLGALLRYWAARQPLLVTIEDVHWADEETLLLFAAVARATAQSRTALVMTTRIEGDPLDTRWRARATGATLVSVDLSPLTVTDALSIAQRFIDVGAFAAQCVERAGGNPLFLEQLLRAAGDVGAGQLPMSIQSVVLARTDLLSAADRRAIQAASILGQRFRSSQLRAILSEPNYDFEMLLRSALLRPTADGLQFAHALVRDGVYASLTHVRRRQLHKGAAAIFIDDPVLRAEHLDRAGDAEAPRAYLAASQQQASLFRHDQAIILATRGLSLAVEARDLVSLALQLGDLQRDAGRGTESHEAYQRAFAASVSDSDRRRALVGLAAANRLTARVDDALAALAEAEPLAAAGADDQALAEIHYLRGNLHFARGEFSACRDEHGTALDAARRAGSLEWQARALSGLADAQYMDCRMATALRHFSDCVDLCDRQGLIRIAAPNRVMMGHCRIYTCAFELALDDMRQALKVAERVGNRYGEMFATQSLAFCLTAAGRYDEADQIQVRALVQARALKARRYEAIILAQRAEVALFHDRHAEARALARESLEASNETGPGFVGPLIYGLIALLEDGEPQRAALAAGEALLAKGSVGHNHFWFRRYAIERALIAKDWDEAARQADALLFRMAGEPLAYSDHLAHRGRALARLGRGDTNAEEELNQLRTRAAQIDLRIDALSDALRRR